MLTKRRKAAGATSLFAAMTLVATACGAGNSSGDGGDGNGGGGSMSLKSSSEGAMLASLDKAIDSEKPIVVTLWHPHWAYSRYDLKDLKDPKNAMGEAEKLHFAARDGFSDDHPDIAKTLKDFTVDDKDLQDLEDTIDQSDDDPAEAVKGWRKDNQDFVKDHFDGIKKGSGKLTIPYISWAEDVALSNLFQQVLEDKGYDVKLTELDAGPIFSSLAKGSSDLFLDYWLPTTHADYKKKYGDKIEDLGVWYDDASLDITVPDYVDDVDSIADLKKHADEFDNQITGIDPGAGIMDQVENHAIPEYNLDEG